MKKIQCRQSGYRVFLMRDGLPFTPSVTPCMNEGPPERIYIQLSFHAQDVVKESFEDLSRSSYTNSIERIMESRSFRPLLRPDIDLQIENQIMTERAS